MSGYKDFVAGDPLTAAQVDGYLMRQSVMVFASTSARDAALSGVLAEGMFCYTSDTDTVWYYTGTAWEQAYIGRSHATLGYAKVTADQTGIDSTLVDLTGLTATVTVGTGRLIRVTGWATFISVSSADERVRMRILKSGNTVSYANSGNLWSSENEGEELHVQFLDVSPTAGSITYKLSAERIAGATNVEMDADTLRPAFILVEDIGAA